MRGGGGRTKVGAGRPGTAAAGAKVILYFVVLLLLRRLPIAAGRRTRLRAPPTHTHTPSLDTLKLLRGSIVVLRCLPCPKLRLATAGLQGWPPGLAAPKGGRATGGAKQ